MDVPVARVQRVGNGERLAQLVAQGLVTPAREPKQRSADLPPPVRADRAVSDLVGEMRR